MSRKYHSYLDHHIDQDIKSHDIENQSNTDTKFHQHHQHNHNIHKINSKILLYCTCITLIFALLEFGFGIFTSSIVLQTDALHMLTDAAGLLIAFVAYKISKKPATVALSFGYGKAEALGALINCVFTVIMTLGLLVEIIIRILHPVLIHGPWILIVATGSFIINCVIAFLLSKANHSLNVKAALLHTLGDIVASVITIIAGIIIYYTHLYIVDPVLSILLVMFMIIANYRLMRSASKVLLGGVPDNINYNNVGYDLEQITGVKDVHDLHIWYITANNAALCAHITTDNNIQWEQILLACQKLLETKYNIYHITLQYEPVTVRFNRVDKC
jgi:cobalt-zinc-cadmium efflux system protein